MLSFLKIDQQFWCATWSTFERLSFQWVRVGFWNWVALSLCFNCLSREWYSLVLRKLHQTWLTIHMKPDDAVKKVENLLHDVQFTHTIHHCLNTTLNSVNKSSNVVATSCSHPFIWSASNTREWVHKGCIDLYVPFILLGSSEQLSSEHCIRPLKRDKTSFIYHW